MKNLVDRELVKLIQENNDKNASSELYTRYERQIYKQWNKFLSMLNYSQYAYSFKTEFESGIYEEAFVPCVNAINLNRVLNDNWKFVSYFRFYLMNFRNSMVKLAMEKYHTEVSTTKEVNGEEINILDGTDFAIQSTEDNYFENEFKKDIRDSVEIVKSILNEKQNKIFSLIIQDVNNNKISISTGIPYNQVKKEREFIKNTFEKVLYSKTKVG